jgi:hypothetical protein
MSGSLASPDAGVLEMRGGGPIHDRDEQFLIEAIGGGGFRIRTRIAPLDGRYEIDADMHYGPDWLPHSLRGVSRAAGAEHSVEIVRRGDHALLTLLGDDAAPVTQRLPLAPDTLMDLEPSALPMWAMTRRYGRSRRGTQTFRWIGRSLLRDLTLEALEVPLTLVRQEATGDMFEFSETYAAPGGASFTVDFTLSTDQLGRLQRFTVGAGTRQVVGVRRPTPGTVF